MEKKERKRKPVRLRADKKLLYHGFKRFVFKECPQEDDEQCVKCAFESKRYNGFCEFIPCIASERPDNQDGYFIAELQ